VGVEPDKLHQEESDILSVPFSLYPTEQLGGVSSKEERADLICLPHRSKGKECLGKTQGIVQHDLI